jgi:hypothetical protein
LLTSVKDAFKRNIKSNKINACFHARGIAKIVTKEKLPIKSIFLPQIALRLGFSSF